MPSQNASFVHSSTRASSSSRHSGFRRQRSTDDSFDPDRSSDNVAGDRPVLEQDFSPTAPGGQALVGERPVESQPESAFTVVPSDPQARAEAEAGLVESARLRSSASVSAESLVKYNKDGECPTPAVNWRATEAKPVVREP